MAALVDTNILVYRFDARFAEKQQCSEDFQHDRAYGTVRVINPFHSPPDSGSAARNTDQ